MDRALQATIDARISKNGKGIDPRVENYHAEGAYRRGEHGRASFPSAEKRRSEEMRGEEGVLSPGKGRNGSGVKR